MMKRFLSLLLALLFLPLGVPALADILSQEDRYATALHTLNTYLSNTSDADIDLQTLQMDFLQIGSYEAAPGLMLYTAVLAQLESDSADRTYTNSYLTALASNPDISALLENESFTATYKAIQSVEQLDLYVQARFFEQDGNTKAARETYMKCLTFFDSATRYMRLTGFIETEEKQAALNQAHALYKEGKFAEAAQQFTQAGESQWAAYSTAHALFADKKYAEAAIAFSLLGQFENAARYVTLCNGLTLQADKQYAKAALEYDKLDSWNDADQRAAYCRALQLYADKQYSKASKAFEKLGSYSSAKKWAAYTAALQLYKDKEFKAAYKAFSALGSFQKSKDYAKKAKEKLEKSITPSPKPTKTPKPTDTPKPKKAATPTVRVTKKLNPTATPKPTQKKTNTPKPDATEKATKKPATPTPSPAPVAVIQYRFRDSYVEYSEWSSWSSWTKSAQTASDLKEVQTAHVYGWWAAKCAKCGNHNPYHNSNHKCKKCGIVLTDGKGLWSHAGAYTTDVSGMQTILGRANGRYINGLAYWRTSSNDGTGYRYRTRTAATKWSDWSSWSETKPSSASNREIDSRVIYR